MVAWAAAPLDETEIAELRAELDETRRVRDRYAGQYALLRRERMRPSSLGKLHAQIAACDRCIARMERNLAEAELEAA